VRGPAAGVAVFAYGSLMCAAELRGTCPSAQPLGRARLDGYRLAFTRLSRKWRAGVADIVRSDGDAVWGVVFTVPASEMDGLRAREGAGVGAYREIDVRVVADCGELRARAYEVVDKEPEHVPPAAAYVDLMIAGAREHRLPVRYAERLSALPATR
jgi:cation transport regulator ChaC